MVFLFKVFWIIAISLVLASAFASAKEVNVVYNFPLGNATADIKETITVPEDANAFSAFLKVAESESLTLDISYYDFDGDGIKESAFINSVNSLAGSADFTKYWQFSTNNSPAMVGISSFVPASNDVVSLDYLDGRTQDALEWLLDNQKSTGAFGDNLFQTSLALAGLSLAQDNNVSVSSNALNNAKNFLLGLQESNAGFGDDLYTSAAIIALLSNGKSIEDFKVSGKSSIDLLREHQLNDGGFKSGSSESDVDTTSWASIAFAQAGIAQPIKNSMTPSDFLLSAQHSNGSWGYNVGDSTESKDFTEEALIALAAAGNPKDANVSNSLDWLSSQQNSEGCIDDGFRTALGSIAFRMYNEISEADKAAECLKTLQNGDGSFGRSSNKSNALDTGIAVIALSNATFPLQVSSLENPDINGDFGLNSLVKISVIIKNKGSIKASDVNVQIEGIPSDWLLSSNQGSISSFEEIKPGESKTAEIYARLKSTGSYNIKAVISTTQSSQPINSNTAEIEVKEAVLDAVLSISE